MKKYIVCFLMLIGLTSHLQAQTLTFGPLHSADSPREDWLLPGDTILQAGQKLIYQGKPMKNVKYSVTSSSLTSVQSPLNQEGTSYQGNITDKNALDESYYNNPINDLTYGIAPTYGYGLHKGLNLSLGASAFATFGKNLPHKGGFSQNINATYLAPLTKDGKLWIAGGGYFNNTFWGSDSYRDVGL